VVDCRQPRGCGRLRRKLMKFGENKKIIVFEK